MGLLSLAHGCCGYHEEVEELVMEVIRARLPDVGGHEYMDVQVSKAGEKSWE